MCILRYFLISLFVVVSAATKVGDYDAEIMYRDEIIMKDLDATLWKCASGEVSEPEVSCDAMHYLAYVRGLENSYRFGDEFAFRYETDSSDHTRQLSTLSGDVAYSLLFESYIVKKKPVKCYFLALSLNASNVYTSIRLYNELWGDSEDVSFQQVAMHYPELISAPLPRVLANNYLPRVPESFVLSSLVTGRAAGISKTPPSADGTIDYKHQWPAFKRLRREAATSVFQCPSHMHLVVWAANKSVDIRLFPVSAAKYFNPTFGTFGDNTSFVTNATNASVPLFVTAEKKSRAAERYSKPPLHFARFKTNGYEDLITERNATEDRNEARVRPLFSHETTLTPNEFLFVPHGFLVSIKVHGVSINVSSKDSVLPDGDALVDFVGWSCFVDASNLNIFRNALEMSAKVSTADQRLLDAINAPNFVKTMHKSPPDPVFNFFETESTRGTGNEGLVETTVGASSKFDHSINPYPHGGQQQQKSRDRRKNKRGGGTESKNEFKEWQDSSKWEFMVTALTVVKPSNVRVTSLRRADLDLSWNSLFVPGDSDKTNFGFNVYICDAFSDGQIAYNTRLTQEALLGLTSPAGTQQMGKPCQMHVFMKGSKALQQTVDTTALTKYGYELPQFSCVIRDLLPQRVYQIFVGVVYDSSVTINVAHTLVVQTLPVSVPLRVLPPIGQTFSKETTMLIAKRIHASIAMSKHPLDGDVSAMCCYLSFQLPSDNGGGPIRGFHVMGRHSLHKKGPGSGILPNNITLSMIDRVNFERWHWHGDFQAVLGEDSEDHYVKVCNLFPGGDYQFQVIPYNDYGVSTEAPFISNLVEVDVKVLSAAGGGSGRVLPEIFGPHHMNYYPARTNAIEAPHLTMGHKTLVLNKKEVPSWWCHWMSNADFKVTAIPIPEKSQHDLIYGSSSDSYFGKIVVSKRDGDAFYRKALLAQEYGAWGLVILDDGQCTEYDQSCIPGAERNLNEGFAANDIPSAWTELRIPVHFLLLRHAETIFEGQKEPPPYVARNHEEL